MSKPLKVLINAQLIRGRQSPGVNQFLAALVHALGRLSDSDEQYVLITDPQNPDWVKSHLGPNQTSVVGPRRKLGRTEPARGLMGPLGPPARKLWRMTRRLLSPGSRQYGPAVPESDGFFESLDGDVIHFPFQRFTRCRVPAVYNPHDLQHLHYPQFYSSKTIRWRETVYRAGCHQAQAVVAESDAVKHDLMKQYGLDSQKILVIRRGSPTEFYGEVRKEDLRKIRDKFGLPERFAFYPARARPNKNHARLLEAVSLVRDRCGVSLNLVCTGTRTELWSSLKGQIKKLKLGRQVSFLGYVSSAELRALYHLAQFLVFPSFFEGGGFPVVEGMYEGLPVACSEIPPLLEYGGDAVLVFDPHSVESMAAGLLRISQDDALRAELRERGSRRVRIFTWERAAKGYRALYRKVAGFPLSEEDMVLLASDRVPPEPARSGAATSPIETQE
jgi:glycosyltransferase involved in cell wall biosynthesis